VKRCSRCKIEKEIDQFRKRRSAPDGRQYLCNECHRDDTRNRKYGITSASYDAMLEQQGGGCAVCHEACITGRRLAVDHEHASGQVRGLLCSRCNVAVGFLQESRVLARNVADYLDQHTFAVII
jgi:hypothetical protein